MIITYLERHHDEKNMHRFYRLSLSPTVPQRHYLVNMPSSENGADAVTNLALENEGSAKKIGLIKKPRPIMLLRSLNFRSAEKGIS